MSLFKWLGIADAEEPAASGVDEVERALEGLEPERARHIACFAYILGRVARADHHVSTEETAEMERLVAARAGLPADQASLAVRIATSHGIRHGGTEDFLVTREFAGLATREDRLALLDCLFALSSSDQSIVMLEDNEVRRIASELKLEHGDFITARAAYLQHLKVLGRGGTGEPR
ncbi:MAG: TerB family tellurite resistance protein [Vicinamibacterales bacterium]